MWVFAGDEAEISRAVELQDELAGKWKLKINILMRLKEKDGVLARLREGLG